MVTLYFTKKFAGGLLKGLACNDQMTLESVESAMAYVARARKGTKPRRGFGSPWIMVDHSFQKYDRS